ncbi:hypothetical protein PGQ11_002987 [Apiospora arundinis]|uniref:Uncharacterized protein n=1 Tax=Apiospora arundinis TaxID=335852 RepID=A0ABR2J3U7_9PEZI
MDHGTGLVAVPRQGILKRPVAPGLQSSMTVSALRWKLREVLREVLHEGFVHWRTPLWVWLSHEPTSK